MNNTLIKWKLAELMARHRITGKAMAEKLQKSETSIAKLRKATKMPRLNSDDLEKLLIAVEELADSETKFRTLELSDLIEWERGL